MIKYSNFILQPLKNHKFKVLKDIYYKDIIVKKGFRSDGASVPRIFWFFFPPNRTDYLPCAIIHDYLCDKEEYKKADKCFKKCLEELKVDRFSKILMYFAVRSYHIFKYELFKKIKKDI